MGIHFLSDTVHSPLMCGINFYVVFFSYRAVRGPVGGFAHFRLKILGGGCGFNSCSLNSDPSITPTPSPQNDEVSQKSIYETLEKPR